MRRVSHTEDGHRTTFVGGPLAGVHYRVDVTPFEVWYLDSAPDADPADWGTYTRRTDLAPRVHRYVLTRAARGPVTAVYEHTGVQDSVTITDPDTVINLNHPSTRRLD